MKNWKIKAKGDIKNANYYVYEHYLDEKLFYIGKGSRNRCFEYGSRSIFWKNAVNGRENEVVVKIKKTFTNEYEALKFEKYRIMKMSKKYNLANQEHNYKYVNQKKGQIRKPIVKRNKTKTKAKPSKYKTYKVKNTNTNIQQLEDSLMSFNLQNRNIKKHLKLKSQDTLIIFEILKDKIEEMRKPEYSNGKQLNEMIEVEKNKTSNNNLILAPFGSGKSDLIKKLICHEENQSLILISNDEFKKDVSEYYTKLKNSKRNVIIMSYKDFGEKIRFNDDFAKGFTQILSIEFFDLLNNQNDSSSKLSLSLKFLLNEHENIKIYNFSEFEETLNKLKNKENNIKVFDYLDNSKIKRYVSRSEIKINSLEQIRPILKSQSQRFSFFNYKTLAFSKTISGQKRIAQLAEEEGYTPLVLWSINNKDDQMSKEQLKARKDLIQTGTIPEPYNFLILNNSKGEIWRIKDDRLKLTIINNTNDIERAKSLSRIERDLDILVYRVGKDAQPDIFLNIDKEHISVWLTNQDKKKICKDLNIKDNSGRTMMWPSIKGILEKQGYSISDAQKIINGKRVRVSKILMTIE